jgi:hypothetical protein
MADLGRRLRDVVDPVVPISLDEIKQERPERRPRRSRKTLGGLVLVAAAAVIIVVVFAVSQPSTSTTVKVSGTGGGAVSSSITKDRMTVTLTLDRASATSGTTLRGELTVDNKTGRPFRNGDACPGDNFNLYLEGHHIPYALPSGDGCAPPYAFKPGVTVFAVTVPTRIGAQPFPLGRYRLVITFYPTGLPIPPPLPVTLTPAPPTDRTPTSQPSRTGTQPPSTAPTVNLRMRVTVEAHSVRAGATVHGTLLVTNLTSRIILVNDCKANGWPLFELVNGPITNVGSVTGVACGRRLDIPLHPGLNRFPLTFTATYGSCAQNPAGVRAHHPLCGPQGPPPLPPGRYHTKSDVDGLQPGTYVITEVTLTLTK